MSRFGHRTGHRDKGAVALPSGDTKPSGWTLLRTCSYFVLMASEKAHAFYHPEPTPLVRARRAQYATNLKDAFRDGFCIWVFCTWCGHVRLTEPGYLAALVKDPPNALDELEQRLRCDSCKPHGMKLIPTDRTSVSIDRMGARRRD